MNTKIAWILMRIVVGLCFLMSISLLVASIILLINYPEDIIAGICAALAILWSFNFYFSLKRLYII